MNMSEIITPELISRLKLVASWNLERGAMVSINRHQATEILNALRETGRIT